MRELEIFKPQVGQIIKGKRIVSVDYDQSQGAFICKTMDEPECIPFKVISTEDPGSKMDGPKVGDKVHGQTIKSVVYDEKRGVYNVKTEVPAGSGGCGIHTIIPTTTPCNASSGGGPSSSCDPENGCNIYDGPFMHPFKVDEIEYIGQTKVAGITGNSFEDVAKPLIKWINDNANPHAIIVIDGSSAVLYSGEKSVLTEEFIKD